MVKDDRVSVAARIEALEALFWLAFDQGDHDRTEAVAQEGFELSAKVEIEGSVGASLRIMLAGPAWKRGDYEWGKEILEESLQISREAGDKNMIAQALGQLAGTA